MIWFEDLITELGHSLDVETLQADAEGVVGLAFASGERLIIERDAEGEGMNITLMKQIADFEALRDLEKSLSLCHYKRGMAFAVVPGLIGDNTMTYSIYLHTDDANISNLDQAIDRLKVLANEAGVH